MYGIKRYKTGYVVMCNNYYLSINDQPMNRTSKSYDDEYRYTHDTDQFGCRTFTVYETAEDAQAHATKLNAKEQALLAEEREIRAQRRAALRRVFKPIVLGIFFGTIFGIVLGLLF